MAHHHFDWKPVFLESLRAMPVVAHACAAVGIERSTAYRAREADEGFAQAWDDAMEEGVDRAEGEAYRRAVVGFEEPVIDKGRLSYRYERVMVKHIDAATGQEVEEETYRPVLDENGQPIPLTIKKHSDALLALYLKGRRKKVYAERTEVTGAEGQPLTVIDETKKAARAAQLIALAQSRKDNGDLA
jgi:hypothetical protein